MLHFSVQASENKRRHDLGGGYDTPWICRGHTDTLGCGPGARGSRHLDKHVCAFRCCCRPHCDSDCSLKVFPNPGDDAQTPIRSAGHVQQPDDQASAPCRKRGREPSACRRFVPFNSTRQIVRQNHVKILLKPTYRAGLVVACLCKCRGKAIQAHC